MPARIKHLYRSAILGALPLLLVFFAFPPARCADDGPATMFVVGEELVYNVRFSFFDLGQVRVKTLREVRVDSSIAYEGTGLIDSYSSVPFVDVHAVFESRIDSAMYSRHFVGRSRIDNDWETSIYTFDYPAGAVSMKVFGKDSVLRKQAMLETRDVLQDGLSLFFYARKHLFAGRELVAPTVIKEERVLTYLDMRTTRESVEVDAIDYPVDTRHFVGNADFVGFFGLTGDFEGWFSNDGARIPIKAHLKIILGNVTVELMEWKRPGWEPPRGED